VTAEQAAAFANEWIAAWNAHDIDRVVAHYSHDIELSSPVIVQVAGEPSGMLRGKQALRDYFAKALARLPDLRFELVHVFAGIDNVAMCYRGPRGLVTEIYRFGPDGLAYAAAALYDIGPDKPANGATIR